METQKLKDLNPELQPREKLKTHGVQSLTDAELLAILLKTGIQGKNVLELSEEIMNWASGRWSTLTNLTLTDMNRQFKGMGDVKAMQLIAALEVGRRRSVETQNVTKIKDRTDIVNALYRYMADLTIEHFWCIYLTNANSIIAMQKVAEGGISGVSVDVRVIMRQALGYNATGIVLAHNHPSGSCKPSRLDIDITKKVHEAAETLDIRLIDHVILTSSLDTSYSFYENGLL